MKKHNSLSYKVLTILLLAIVVTVIIMQFVSFQANRKELFEKNAILAEQILDRASNSFISPIWNLDTVEVNKIIMLEMANENLEAIILRNSEQELYTGKLRNSRNVIVNYLGSKIHNNILDKSYTVLTNELFFQEEAIGIVEIYMTNRVLKEKLKALVKSTIIQTFILVFVIFFVAYLSLRKLILNPILSLKDVVEQIKESNYKKRAPIYANDEIGSLAKTFNMVVEQLSKSFYKQTQLLDKLEENNKQLITQKEELFESNKRMNIANKEMEVRNWIKTGQNELSTILRNEQSLDKQIKTTLSFLSEYTASILGAFYLYEKERLVFHSGYNFADERLRYSSFQFGEGAIGDAAQKKDITILDTKDNFPLVDLGFDKFQPRCFMFVPLYDEDKILGIIEIAAVEKYDERVIQFVKESIEIITIAISNSVQNQKIKELLRQTQSQSEQLQEQQEEMIQTNEELSAQTRALKESEERLQTQQEELRVTNEELEERSKALEQQRDFVSKQNDELKIAKEEVNKKANALEAANKYKSEFLANMSHELRTPLNSIMILSQLLQENKKGNLTDREIEFAKTINSSGNDLLSLINEILDLSKVEAGKMVLNPENIRIQDFIGSLSRIFRPVAEKKQLQFNIEVGEDVPQNIYHDNQRLQQVIRNLLSNAIKFTAEGEVRLILKMIEKSHPHHLGEENPNLMIAVKDSGIGIPKEKIEAIFDAFQQADGTTSREFGGTGLGLSISKELVRLMQGKIVAESKPNIGSFFSIIIPVRYIDEADTLETNQIINIDEPIEKEMQRETDQIETHSKNEIKKEEEQTIIAEPTVLVIDDDERFCNIIVEIAHDQDFRIVTAPNGVTGYELANELNPTAIILDIGLPDMEGWEVMKKLKQNEKTKTIPVYFLSAEDKDLSAKKLGAIGFDSKPVNIDKLKEIFNKINNFTKQDKEVILVLSELQKRYNFIENAFQKKDFVLKFRSPIMSVIPYLEQNPINLLIVDLDLPDGLGIEIIEAINKNVNIPKFPIIVTTANVLSESENEHLHRLVDRVILEGEKSKERLLDDIKLLMDKKLEIVQKKSEHVQFIHDKDQILDGKKILIIDDDMRNVFALTSFLEDKGMDVVIGKNGYEGLKKLQANPTINVVLTDIMMPGLDGYETIREIRKMPDFKSTPIIAITAKAMKDDKTKCMNAGANDYLTKPVNLEKLHSLIKIWVYGK